MHACVHVLLAWLLCVAHAWRMWSRPAPTQCWHLACVVATCTLLDTVAVCFLMYRLHITLAFLVSVTRSARSPTLVTYRGRQARAIIACGARLRPLYQCPDSGNKSEGSSSHAQRWCAVETVSSLVNYHSTLLGKEEDLKWINRIVWLSTTIYTHFMWTPITLYKNFTWTSLQYITLYRHITITCNVLPNMPIHTFHV